MRKGYLTPPVLIILAIIIFAVAILIAINTDLVKRTKKEPSPTPVSSSTISPSPTTQQSSPTPAETANWETYQDNVLGYKVKYPQNLKATRIENRDDSIGEADLIGGASLNLIYNDDKFRPQASEISIWVMDSEGLKLEEWLMKHSSPAPFGSPEIKEFYGYKELGNATIDRLQGIKFTDDVMGFTSTWAAVIKGNKVYLVGYVYVSDDLDKTYNQIISTFQFTD